MRRHPPPRCGIPRRGARGAGRPAGRPGPRRPAARRRRPAGTSAAPRARPRASPARSGSAAGRGRRAARPAGPARSRRWLCGPRPCRLTARCGPRPAPGGGPPSPVVGTTAVDHTAREQELRRRTRGGEQQPPPRVEPAQPAQRRHRRQGVAEAQRPQGEDRRVRGGTAHGQEVSVEVATTSSRSSQPRGLAQCEQDRLGDVRGVVEHRVRPGLVLLGAVVEEVRGHAARDEQGDADLAGGLGGERPGEPHHAELRRAVGGRVRDGLDARASTRRSRPCRRSPAGAGAPPGPRRRCRSG